MDASLDESEIGIQDEEVYALRTSRSECDYRTISKKKGTFLGGMYLPYFAQ